MKLLRRELVDSGLNDREVIKNLQDLQDRVSDPGCRWSLYSLFGYVQTAVVDQSSARGQGIALSGRIIERGHSALTFAETLLVFEMNREVGYSLFADLAITNSIGESAYSDNFSTRELRTGEESAWFKRFEVRFIPEWLAGCAELNVGRFGLSLFNLILQKPLMQPLTSSWLDNGKWIVDGFNVDYFADPFSGSVFVGQRGGRLTTTSAGDQIEEMRVGRFGSPWNTSAPKYQRPRGLVDSSAANMEVNDIAGATLKWKGLESLDVEGRFLSLNSHQNALVDGKLANRLDIYSLEAKADPGDWTFDASYNQSVLMGKGTDVVNKENEFISAYAKVDADEVEAMLEYRQIGANYSAPGDWGRIGMWWNPVDIEGFQAQLKATVDERTDLSFVAETYRGLNDSISDWGRGQKVNRGVLALMHNFGRGYSLKAEQEWVEYRDGKGPKPTESWTTLTLFCGITQSISAQLVLQYGAYDSKGLSRFKIGDSSKLSGSTFGAQIMYKF